MFEYNTQKQIEILQRMSEISTMLSKFELANMEDSKDYKKCLDILDNLEEMLVELRETQNQES